jgi:ribosomal protein S7
VERLACTLMKHGRNSGKKLMACRIVKHTMELIHVLTDQNPVQVIRSPTAALFILSVAVPFRSSSRFSFMLF